MVCHKLGDCAGGLVRDICASRAVCDCVPLEGIS